jgi:CRP-like cAMP-binding protein
MMGYPDQQEFHMSREFELLRLLPYFDSIPEQRLKSSSLLWTVRNLKEDETIWWQGEPADDLAFILSGRLRVHISEELIAELRSGELVGEAAAFTRDHRTASVSAKEVSQLLLLPISHMETLRGSHPDVYDIIIEQCLSRMARRVQDMDRKIAKLARGDSEAPRRKEDSALGKLWRKLTGAGSQLPPTALESLRKLPRLKKAEDAVLEDIITVTTPHFVEKGRPLFLESDPGESVFLLADGCVDVMRNVRGGRAEKLASLYPGALFGTGSLLLRERRNAACVASPDTNCWVYEMDVKAHSRLKGEAGRLWRESLVAALSFQLRTADDRLVALKLGGRPSKSDYDKIRCGLEGYQGS